MKTIINFIKRLPRLYHLKKFNSFKIKPKLSETQIDELIELNKETSCQAETVLNGILKAKLKGGIFIKDVDNIFSQKIIYHFLHDQ